MARKYKQYSIKEKIKYYQDKLNDDSYNIRDNAFYKLNRLKNKKVSKKDKIKYFKNNLSDNNLDLEIRQRSLYQLNNLVNKKKFKKIENEYNYIKNYSDPLYEFVDSWFDYD
jgi:hypothetical protein